jgi:glucuronate isomerase
MEFMHEDFLLRGPTAKRLFHDVAKDLPIIDYHCHLPPKDLAEPQLWKPFRSLVGRRSLQVARDA